MRGLILDFGGVLTSSIFASFEAFCRENQIPLDHFRSVLTGIARGESGDDLFHLVETGRIDEGEFNVRLAAMLSEGLNSPLDPEGLKHRMFALTRLDTAMMTAVERLRESGIRTGLLSNSWGGNDYPMDLLDRLFHTVVISGEVGLRKPQPEIYLLTAERLTLPARKCVFVDDLETNVAGAEAVGMTGVHHSSTDSTLARLEEIFGVTLGAEQSRPAQQLGD